MRNIWPFAILSKNNIIQKDRERERELLELESEMEEKATGKGFQYKVGNWL